MKSADQIVMEAGMSARPEYYSGRGATSSDLNGTILDRIYTAINQNAGSAAAANFVRMVDDLAKLSATDFLLALFQLEGNAWVWTPTLAPATKGIYAGDIGSGMGTILGVLSGMNARDETGSIKASFIRSHRQELRTDQRERPVERR